MRGQIKFPCCKKMNFGVTIVFGMTNKDNIYETNSNNGAGHYRVRPYFVINRVSHDKMKLIDYMMNKDLDDWHCKWFYYLVNENYSRFL